MIYIYAHRGSIVTNTMGFQNCPILNVFVNLAWWIFQIWLLNCLSILWCSFCITSALQDEDNMRWFGFANVWIYNILPTYLLLATSLFATSLLAAKHHSPDLLCLFIMEVIFIYPTAENLKWCIKSIGFWILH